MIFLDSWLSFGNLFAMKNPRKVTIRKRKDRHNKPTVYWRESAGSGKSKQYARTFDNLPQAKDFAAQKYLELRADVSPTAVPIEWDRLRRLYLADKRANNCTELTLKLNARTLKRFEQICGPLISAQINQLAIDKYKTERSTQKRRAWQKDSDGSRKLMPTKADKIISSPQLNKELRILRTFVRWMQDRNYNKQKINIKLVRERRKIPRVLTKREIRNLKIEAGKSPDMSCRVSIILGTAQRAGAVERLAIKDVDVEHSRLHFKEKGQRDRILPVSEAVMQVIINYMASLPRGRKWLFHESNPATKTTSRIFPRKRWNKMIETAGLEHVTPHDLRETCLTLLAKSNVSAVIAQKLAGHSNINTTMKYYVNADDEKMLRDAVGELPG